MEFLYDCMWFFFFLFKVISLLNFVSSDGLWNFYLFTWLSFSATYVFNSRLAPVFGLPLNPQAAAEDEKILISSLSIIESYWLQDSGLFLLGENQPSIADLSLVCEIMQLEVGTFGLFSCLNMQVLEHSSYLWKT